METQMNRGIRSILTAGLLASICQTGFAEYRVWVDANGKQLEAEFVRVVDGKVVLLKRDGSEIRVSLDTLGMGDRKYAILQSPPRIEIQVSTDTDRENRAVDGGHRRDTQIQQESVRLEVSVKKTSPAAYEAPLESEVYLIGYSGRRDEYVILDRTPSKFRFTTGNKNLHTYSSGKVQLVQIEAGMLVGVEYKGYLALVRDRTGEVLAMKCSKLDLEKHADAIIGAGRGTLFDSGFIPLVREKKPRTRDQGGINDRRRLPGRLF